MESTTLFTIFSVLAVAGAAGLILFRHPMNGAMSFVVTLIALAGLYALLAARLIFAIQLIVYAGAIMSLIVFIIMFLNIGEKDLPDESGRWLYLIGGGVVIAPILMFLLKVVGSLPGKSPLWEKASVASRELECSCLKIGCCRLKSCQFCCSWPW